MSKKDVVKFVEPFDVEPISVFDFLGGSQNGNDDWLKHVFTSPPKGSRLLEVEYPARHVGKIGPGFFPAEPEGMPCHVLAEDPKGRKWQFASDWCGWCLLRKDGNISRAGNGTFSRRRR